MKTVENLEKYVKEQTARELARRRENYISYLINEVFGYSSEDDLQQTQAENYYEQLLEEWEQTMIEKIEDFKARLRERLV